MNYAFNASEQFENQDRIYQSPEQLQEQLHHLAVWQSKAVVQLKHFRSACSLYKFCEIDEVNELLNSHSHLILPTS